MVLVRAVLAFLALGLLVVIASGKEAAAAACASQAELDAAVAKERELRALVNEHHPELFLKRPNGWIDWATGGHRMPPFLDYEPVLNKKIVDQYLRDGDVVVGSGPKAGTMWLNNIVMMLRTGGWDDYPGQLAEVFGNHEFVRYPEHTVELRLAEDAAKREYMQKTHGISTMQFFSHSAPNVPGAVALDPKRNPNVKYVVIVRNGREVVRSISDFFNSYTPLMRRQFGDYPPANLTPAQGFTMMTEQLPELYFGHLKGWWPVRNEPNVHLVHFSDLKRHRREVIVGIAEFLGVDASADVIDTVTRKSSLAYMSDPANEPKYLVWVGQPGGEQSTLVPPGSHIRANGGKNDGASDFFTPAVDAKWEAKVNEEFGFDPDLVAWSKDGSGDKLPGLSRAEL